MELKEICTNTKKKFSRLINDIALCSFPWFFKSDWTKHTILDLKWIYSTVQEVRFACCCWVFFPLLFACWFYLVKIAKASVSHLYLSVSWYFSFIFSKHWAIIGPLLALSVLWRLAETTLVLAKAWGAFVRHWNLTALSQRVHFWD